MCESILVLADEADGLQYKKEAHNFRSFISKENYTHTPPYGRQNVTRKRLASLCGTTNESDIINDWENNRRIIPIEIDSINHTRYNSIDKNDIMAEAYTLFKSGYDYCLTKKEIDLLRECGENYRQYTSEEDIIKANYKVPEDGKTCNGYTPADIASYVSELSPPSFK